MDTAADTTALTIALAQYAQLPIGTPFDSFARSVMSIAKSRATSGAHPQLIVYPEMHLFGTPGVDGTESERLQLDAATDLHDDLIRSLSDLSRELGIWLIPGTLPEKAENGGIHNTAVVLSPQGKLVASYRKICPWRPHEGYVPGTSFTVVDIPGKGRIGLTICYDAWFPEISRQVAWLGADMIVNTVRTTTRDRLQEMVLARSNAIVNQVYMASVNAAEPDGMGDSLLVDPEGHVLSHLAGPRQQLLITTVNLDHARRVRNDGTEGCNKLWEEFRDDDPPIPLPLYDGSISSTRWAPRR
ncbi:carbon-nitrogen hydrolase family protein [uncultured Bifidobacterium sp.]|uniref:carbon-nitrogen hydrolase family protein n=1 Tax=uncultured Bifidobacterium sp. TaxID=165187 RepID=UPI00261299F9|nr:carbon-nitrogen hydrolase family protein [uncultured Bifidobacterium sp.]